MEVFETTCNQLQFYAELDSTTCAEFARVAMEFLKCGTMNEKLCTKAAARLAKEPKSVRAALEALMVLFSEALKANLSVDQFSSACCQDLKVSQEVASSWAEVYGANKESFTAAPHTSALPRFKDLQWRLDAEVASSSASTYVRPTVTLNVQTYNSHGNVQTHLFDVEPADLIHLTHELEKALNETRTREYRKIVAHHSS